MFIARSAAAFVLAVGLTACASGPEQAGGPRPTIDVASQSERILADARRKKEEQDCAAAIPSYRVVSSFGKGHDTAQYELGACLLETPADNAATTSLLRDEGLFWLRRAAYAGNARAQLALAGALSGAQSHSAAGVAPDLVESYGWSLIYADNAAHNLYGLPDLHPMVADHFRAQMSDAMIDTAENFAAAFRRVEMAVFAPPAFERANRGRGGPVPDGERRERRRR